ncbi:hypothetical protein LUZ63_010758 [Rhynchospora breviuscula]|uniref:Clp R domain-containing protein n=1 Tax=Rhynchospora breviuscula TaxID=2022672 RepID=A0A9Q0CHQ0_9POAL|nr:hypothetical protein LUZ63_010758 [Rhynchospora breviuscula]
MAGSLVQSAALPALHESRAQLRRSTKTHAIARVSMSKLQLHSCPSRLYGSCVPRTFFLGAGSIVPGQTMRPVRKQAISVAVKAMFEPFADQAIKVVMLAQEEAIRLGYNFVGTEQILLGLIGEGTGIAAEVLKSMRVLELSLREAFQLGHNYLRSEHLLLGLLREGEGVAARVLENLGVDPSNMRNQVTRMVWESTEAVGAGVGGGSSGQKMPTLEEYRTNLTKLAEEGKLDPVVERQEQIKRVMQNIWRRTEKNSFEKFTEKALKVVMLAQEEARRSGHNFVGTEQILLGLIGEGTGIAAEVLKSMGMNIKDARVEVEKIIGRGTGFVSVEIPFTPRAKRVLELSLREAFQLGHKYIGSEHLLLGLLQEGGGVAARVLETLGANPSNIRTRVTRMALESTETG